VAKALWVAEAKYGSRASDWRVVEFGGYVSFMGRKRGTQHLKPQKRRRVTPRPRGDQLVTVTARSWEALAADEALRFPIPSTEAPGDAAAVDYWWRLIQYATDVQDPAQFAPFNHDLDDALLAACDRYVRTARGVAGSVALNHGGGMTVRIGDDGLTETIDADLPPADAVAGFAALLRHFYSPEEKASFRAVSNLLNRENTLRADDRSTTRAAALKAWQEIEGRSRRRSIQNQAIQRLIVNGVAPRDPDLETYPDPAPPEEIISDYFYGDHLHWGRKAAVVDQRATDPFTDAYFRTAFLNAAAGLAHIYIGFAALVETATSTAG
jgi:hypothetical protein